MFTGVLSLSLSPPPPPVPPLLPRFLGVQLNWLPMEQAMKCQPRATSDKIVKEGLRSRALLPAKLIN